jgi:hypothetical protein
LDQEYYHNLRRGYQPEDLNLLIVAESPPASGLYFYNPDGKRSEPIFAAFMKQLGIVPLTKATGLEEMQRRGWLLIDAIYEPVDERFKGQDYERNEFLRTGYPLLKEDILSLNGDKRVPIVLIKSNICDVFERLLVADGFTVLNRGARIPLPMYKYVPDFHRLFKEALTAAGLAI